jgi:hypothetical protein
MATITVKKPEKQEGDDVMKVDQRRPKLERFRLQVDRQTKSSFASFDEAEGAGKAIKKAHPVVYVTVYDTVKNEQTTIQ